MKNRFGGTLKKGRTQLVLTCSESSKGRVKKTEESVTFSALGGGGVGGGGWRLKF